MGWNTIVRFSLVFLLLASATFVYAQNVSIVITTPGASVQPPPPSAYEQPSPGSGSSGGSSGGSGGSSEAAFAYPAKNITNISNTSATQVNATAIGAIQALAAQADNERMPDKQDIPVAGGNPKEQNMTQETALHPVIVAGKALALYLGIAFLAVVIAVLLWYWLIAKKKQSA